MNKILIAACCILGSFSIPQAQCANSLPSIPQNCVRITYQNNRVLDSFPQNLSQHSFQQACALQIVNLGANQTYRAMEKAAKGARQLTRLEIRNCQLSDLFTNQFERLMQANFSLRYLTLRDDNGNLTTENIFSIFKCLSNHRNLRTWELHLPNFTDAQFRIANKYMTDIACLNGKIGPRKSEIQALNATLNTNMPREADQQSIDLRVVDRDRMIAEMENWRYMRDDIILSMFFLETMSNDQIERTVTELSEDKWVEAVDILI